MAKNKKRNGVTHSLAIRQRMFPVNVYGEMVKEIPKKMLSNAGQFGYFGTPVGLMLLKKRREELGIKHSKENTKAIENDRYFINGAIKDAPEVEADYKQISYNDYINNGLVPSMNSPKWRLDNKPYNWPGQGAEKLWNLLVEADNRHGILDWQGDILPTSLMRGNDSELEKMRNCYFDDYGLYKIRPWPFDTFIEWGAKVSTAGYFCEKGYGGKITVKTDVSTYDYNFRSKRLIVTPDTVDEVDFIFNCYNSKNYQWHSIKYSESFFNGKTKEIKNKQVFSFTKNKTFKYPIVIRLTGKNTFELGYTSYIVDNSINFDKVIIPYQCSSYASGGTDIGNVVYIPAGIQLMSGYRWTKVTPTTALIEVKYLTSFPVKYLINEWRTSQTNDGHQLNVIPKLTDFTVKTEDDILEFLGGKDIKKEIENGYRRKTKQK
jgi:hypothetical protein